MYEHEEVEESEAKNFADEIGAIYQKTSAKESNGVEDLFIKIGKKFLNPKSDAGAGGQGGNTNKPGDNKNKKSIKLKNDKNSDKPKKGCC